MAAFVFCWLSSSFWGVKRWWINILFLSAETEELVWFMLQNQRLDRCCTASEDRFTVLYGRAVMWLRFVSEGLQEHVASDTMRSTLSVELACGWGSCPDKGDAYWWDCVSLWVSWLTKAVKSQTHVPSASCRGWSLKWCLICLILHTQCERHDPNQKTLYPESLHTSEAPNISEHLVWNKRGIILIFYCNCLKLLLTVFIN